MVVTTVAGISSTAIVTMLRIREIGVTTTRIMDHVVMEEDKF